MIVCHWNVPRNSHSMNELNNPQCKNEKGGFQHDNSAHFASQPISERKCDFSIHTGRTCS